MIVPIYVVSNDTLKITSEQLRTTNLIFSEHQQLRKTVPLLNSEINNLKAINQSLERTDSARMFQLLRYEAIINDKDKTLDKLNKSLKRNRKIAGYSSATAVCILVLCLFLK